MPNTNKAKLVESKKNLIDFLNSEEYKQAYLKFTNADPQKFEKVKNIQLEKAKSLDNFNDVSDMVTHLTAIGFAHQADAVLKLAGTTSKNIDCRVGCLGLLTERRANDLRNDISRFHNLHQLNQFTSHETKEKFCRMIQIKKTLLNNAIHLFNAIPIPNALKRYEDIHHLDSSKIRKAPQTSTNTVAIQKTTSFREVLSKAREAFSLFQSDNKAAKSEPRSTHRPQ